MENQKKAAALSYDPAKDRAPQLVAAGRGLIAEKILEIARSAKIATWSTCWKLWRLMPTLPKNYTGWWPKCWSIFTGWTMNSAIWATIKFEDILDISQNFSTC